MKVPKTTITPFQEAKSVTIVCLEGNAGRNKKGESSFTCKSKDSERVEAVLGAHIGPKVNWKNHESQRVLFPLVSDSSLKPLWYSFSSHSFKVNY